MIFFSLSPFVCTFSTIKPFFVEAAVSDKDPIINETKPAGYGWLIERYELKVVPNHHRSSIATSGGKKGV